MQVPWGHYLKIILSDKPTVGALMDLCEENYAFISRLIPDLSNMQGRDCSRSREHADLYLEILEQSRYTSLIHLTYYFDSREKQEPDPDVVLKVYHDAGQVEVVDLKQSVLPLHSLYDAPGLQNKWQANLFVSKWLAFCVHQGHQFP